MTYFGRCYRRSYFSSNTILCSEAFMNKDWVVLIIMLLICLTFNLWTLISIVRLWIKTNTFACKALQYLNHTQLYKSSRMKIALSPENALTPFASLHTDPSNREGSRYLFSNDLSWCKSCLFHIDDSYIFFTRFTQTRLKNSFY